MLNYLKLPFIYFEYRKVMPVATELAALNLSIAEPNHQQDLECFLDAIDQSALHYYRYINSLTDKKKKILAKYGFADAEFQEMQDLIKDQESLAREIRSLRTRLAPSELTYFNEWWSESLRTKRLERLKKKHLKRAEELGYYKPEGEADAA